MYAVVLQNDNSTHPMFVVEVLSTVFDVAKAEANQIMMRAHNEGNSLVRIMSKELAETKIEQARVLIAANPHANGRNSDGPCELTFTMRAETNGE
jgi:ATP-dependent Clp protease adapter protein ClpS